MRRALIVAPHPDDEVIGAGLLIDALVRGGARVDVAIVTDGAASHPGSRRWPHAALTAERRRESRRALKRLGVPAGAVSFLALADGSLAADRRGCCRAVARAIARRRGLDLIVGPDAGDAHPDHRAVRRAIDATPGPARRLGYRVWPPRSLGGGRVLSLARPGGHAAKRSWIRAYRTQLGAIRDDPAGFAIARHELDAFARPIEHFLEARW